MRITRPWLSMYAAKTPRMSCMWMPCPSRILFPGMKWWWVGFQFDGAAFLWQTLKMKNMEKKSILPYYWRLPYFDQTNLSKLYHPEIDQKYLITPSGSESIHRTSEHLLMSLYFLAWGLSCVSLQINTLVSIFSEEKNNYHLY